MSMGKGLPTDTSLNPRFLHHYAEIGKSQKALKRVPGGRWSVFAGVSPNIAR
jgi:hypothetical protein